MNQPFQIQPEIQDDTIYAESHTLFVEDHPMEAIPLRDDEGNEIPGFFEHTEPYSV